MSLMTRDHITTGIAVAIFAAITYKLMDLYKMVFQEVVQNYYKLVIRTISQSSLQHNFLVWVRLEGEAVHNRLWLTCTIGESDFVVHGQT